jgi:hypothetical protein
MGHCEMGLAVAGLTQGQVNELTRNLAGDWSAFNPAERAALSYTRKQAQTPTAITEGDLQELQRHWGDKAWEIVWWSARCHYMTSVADAFQLPLERDNPFWSMPGAAKRP